MDFVIFYVKIVAFYAQKYLYYRNWVKLNHLVING